MLAPGPVLPRTASPAWPHWPSGPWPPSRPARRACPRRWLLRWSREWTASEGGWLWSQRAPSHWKLPPSRYVTLWGTKGVIWYLVWSACYVLAHLVPNHFFIFFVIKLVVKLRADISKDDVLGQLTPVVVEQSWRKNVFYTVFTLLVNACKVRGG